MVQSLGINKSDDQFISIDGGVCCYSSAEI